MQARLALEHGKRVFLFKSLADTQEWARGYVSRGAVVVESGDDIVRWLKEPEAVRDLATQRWQLSFSLA
jgi:DNA processing protein